MFLKRALGVFCSYFLLFCLTFATPIPSFVGDGVILLEASTGEVLYSKNGYEPFYPASTTKIITSLILADESDFTKIVTQTKESLLEVPSDSSSIGLSPGDSYTYYDGIHAILMRSDNFISHDMAVDYSGSIDAFAAKMNDLAGSIGAYSSFFVNPHGYHDEAHITTPYDLALLTRTAFSSKLVTEIASKPTYTFTNMTTGETFTLEHTAPFFNTSSPYYNPNMVAAKTGFHTPAGRTLAAKAAYDNIELIAVTMHSEYPHFFDDINKLVEYGALNYRLTTDSKGNSFIENISYADWAKPFIEQAIKKNHYTPTLKNYYEPLTKGEFYSLLSKTFVRATRQVSPSVLVDYSSSLHSPPTHHEIQTLLSAFARAMHILLPNNFTHNALMDIYETIPQTLSLQDGIYLGQCFLYYLNYHASHIGLTYTFSS